MPEGPKLERWRRGWLRKALFGDEHRYGVYGIETGRLVTDDMLEKIDVIISNVCEVKIQEDQ